MNDMGIVTRTRRLRDVFPLMADVIQRERGLDDEALYVTKGLVPDDLNFEDGERASIDYITTGAVDRDREIVDPAGAILDDYQKNPVVLFGHDHWSMPIGKAEWIKVDEKGLVAKTVYANTEKANEIYEYRKAGFPLAKSIGFIPLAWTNYTPESEEGKAGVRRKYDKWILLEYSDVPVPSNPEAVGIAISKGLVRESDAAQITITLKDEPEPEPEQAIETTEIENTIKADTVLVIQEDAKQGDIALTIIG
jgi:HK97 family phage prohead protease